MTERKPNRQGQGTGSSPNRDPQYGIQGGTAGPAKQKSGRHPLQPRNGARTRANDGTDNDDNMRAEKPVAE